MGGFLVGIPSCAKVAMFSPPQMFGLYQILDELQARPEVRHANSLDPHIRFFMDSANVWFYGIRDGDLLVYDSVTHELDSLGNVGPALQGLLMEWESTMQQMGKG